MEFVCGSSSGWSGRRGGDGARVLLSSCLPRLQRSANTSDVQRAGLEVCAGLILLGNTRFSMYLLSGSLVRAQLAQCT